MARKLKAYVTSVGFFDLAVAAPSMKAALDAWGSGRNLFQQGFAQETDDPAIVAATMAKPGVVLKRAVGSKGAYAQDAALPKSLPARHAKPPPKPKTVEKHKASAKVVSLADARAAKQAAAAFEKEKARREAQDRKEDAAQERAHKQRAAATEKARAALEKARRRHDETMDAIAAERDALDKRADAEERRWDKEKEKLEDALRHARE